MEETLLLTAVPQWGREGVCAHRCVPVHVKETESYSVPNRDSC